MLGPVIGLIRSKLEAEAPLPASDLAWYREPYERPEPPRPWALVRVVGGVDMLRTHGGLRGGGARGAQIGLVQVFVHVPSGQGQALGGNIADGFATVLQRISETHPDGSQFITDDARLDEGEDIVKDTTDAYDVTLVSVPFEFHHAR